MRRRRVLTGLAFTLLLGMVALVFSPRPALYPDVDFSRAVYDRHGGLLRLKLASDERYRLRHKLDEIAPAAVTATLLYEDRHFYSHPGVNPVALVRAAWSTYVVGQRAMGASTISMQLARLRFDLNTRTIRGKAVQMARALQLERHYSKREILTAYLNLAPYGGNVEGIGTAARIYFGKRAAALSLPEALALAVIPQNPARRDPSRSAGYAQMMAARSRLVDMWVAQHAVDAPVAARMRMPLAVTGTRALPYIAPHFARAQLRGDSLSARTTLDLATQRILEKSIDRYTERLHDKGLHNASAMLVDTRSMAIRAAVGSADFFDASIQGQVDGTRARRSPGSTLKPFLYGLAMDRGLIHPMSLMKDAPARFAAYAPENFDRGFLGPVSATDALIFSRNVPAINLLSRVGHRNFHEFLLDAGVREQQPADHYGLAMILGGNELTMRELVTLYAMLANGGVVQPLISDAARSVSGGRRVLSAEASFLTLEMLRSNPRPDAIGLGAAGDDLPIAWKTGTSYGFRDAWTVGVFGHYVLAVWVGNFDGSSNAALVGRSAAAPLFFEIADALSASVERDPLRGAPPPALNVRRVDVCAATGDLPGQHCPRTKPSWFIPGVSPITVSNVHRAVRLETATGLRACTHDAATTHEVVFEYWPSDILTVFEKAGIAIRRPPAFAADCPLAAQASTGTPPRITSPTPSLVYQVRAEAAEHERLALQATTDSDASWLYWFANQRFLSRSRRDEPVFWQPAAGEHEISVVDDLGRGHTQRVTVAAIQ